MSKTIKIDPVTRIEGHARVLLDCDDNGKVEEAFFCVNELRGFERILVGMQAHTLPQVTARICGVCPTAHHLVAAKALDVAAGVEIPPAARLLREFMYMGHVIHSHALSLFVLAGPDLVFGLHGNAATQNIVGMVAAEPELAKKGLRLRSLGQKINEIIGGRGIHPVTAVAGGISYDVSDGQLQRLQELTGEAVGLVKEFASADYRQFLAERTVTNSYAKEVYIDYEGTEHLYRVSTLARLNVVDGIGTPLAQAEFEQFRARFGRPCHNAVIQMYAKLVELIYACERAAELIGMPALRGDNRVAATFTGGRGVAHIEAPRGTLIHDYEIDERGIVRAANMIIATQQNTAAINRSIKEGANALFSGADEERMLNGLEFVVRCYDPCLACSTHAIGKMALAVELRENGHVKKTIWRG